MKLFVRGLFATSLLFGCLIFSGCATLDGTETTGGDTTPTNPPVAVFHRGETVTVSFSGIPDQIPPHEETIKEDGNITLDLIGAVHAVGKTTGELQAEIHDLYVPKYYVRLTVTVKAGDLVYYVSGEVRSPGRQLYLGETTLTKAITTAGGPGDFASDKAWLTHNGQRIEINYIDAQSDPSKDPQVYPGDQIDVPRRLF